MQDVDINSFVDSRQKCLYLNLNVSSQSKHTHRHRKNMKFNMERQRFTIKPSQHALREHRHVLVVTQL